MRKALIFLVISALSGCDLMTPKLVTVCEDLLKDRLNSPSSYKRIEVSDGSSKLLTRDEYAKQMASDGLSKTIAEFDLKAFDEGTNKPTVFRYFISYDASNGFGVPLRRTAECEYFSRTGEEGDASKYSTKVNGKTGTDWLLDAVNGNRSP